MWGGGGMIGSRVMRSGSRGMIGSCSACVWGRGGHRTGGSGRPASPSDTWGFCPYHPLHPTHPSPPPQLRGLEGGRAHRTGLMGRHAARGRARGRCRGRVTSGWQGWRTGMGGLAFFPWSGWNQTWFAGASGRGLCQCLQLGGHGHSFLSFFRVLALGLAVVGASVVGARESSN